MMYLVVFSLLGGLDLLLTYIGLPSQEEANPLAVFLYAEYGFIALILAKALATLFVVSVLTILLRVKFRWILLYYRVLTGFALIPVIWNLWILST